MASSFIKGYEDSYTSSSSFGVSDGDSKGGVDPIITHLSSHKYYCWLDGGNFCVI